MHRIFDNLKKVGKGSAEAAGKCSEVPNQRLIHVPESGTKNWKTIEEQFFFHGYVKRGEAEKALRKPKVKNGTFLVRRVLNDNSDYVISVKHNEEVFHVLIKCTKTKKLFFVDSYAFLTITQLISFHSKNRVPIRIWTDDAKDIEYVKKTSCDADEMKKTWSTILKKREPTFLLLGSPLPKSNLQINHEQIELTQKLGEGQFGEVFRGLLDYSFKAPRANIAVKKLLDRGFSSADRVALLREADIQLGLSHKNVVKMYGIAASRDPIMILMELCEGNSLEHVVTNQFLSVEAKVYSLYSAANGLAYLHLNGIIHRDIAARNCLFDKNYTLKISDFGLSAVDTTGHGISERKKGRLPVRYMAPETLRTINKYSTKSDVYGYGAMIYEVFHKCVEPFGEFEIYGKLLQRSLINQNIKLYLWDCPKNTDPIGDGIPITMEMLEPEEVDLMVKWAESERLAELNRLTSGKVAKKRRRKNLIEKYETVQKEQIRINKQFDSKLEKPTNEKVCEEIEKIFNECRVYVSKDRLNFVEKVDNDLTDEPISNRWENIMKMLEMEVEEHLFKVVFNDTTIYFSRDELTINKSNDE